MNASELCVPHDANEDDNLITGFFTNRVTKAENVERAKLIALRNLTEEDEIKLLTKITKEKSSKKPIFLVEDVEQISFFSSVFSRKEGLIFYTGE